MRKLGIWQVANDTLTRVTEAHVELERHLEDWISADPALLQEGLVVVGRQIQLECGRLDLLALDPQGRWAVIEIKRGALDRKTVAQVVDYAACLAELYRIRVSMFSKTPTTAGSTPAESGTSTAITLVTLMKTRQFRSTSSLVG